MRELIVLSGWPGVGKSRWTNQYKQQCADKEVVIISSDEIRKEITGRYNDLSQDIKMWQIYEERLNKAYLEKQNCAVILDSTCLSNTKRINWIHKYPDFEKKILVIVKADLEKCRQRNQKRNEEKIIPDQAVIALHKAFQEPCDDVKNQYDEIIYIDGNID